MTAVEKGATAEGLGIGGSEPVGILALCAVFDPVRTRAVIYSKF